MTTRDTAPRLGRGPAGGVGGAPPATFLLDAPATARVVLPPNDALVPARAAADKAALDTAVAEGQITRAQEIAALATLRAQRSPAPVDVADPRGCAPRDGATPRRRRGCSGRRDARGYPAVTVPDKGGRRSAMRRQP